MALSDEKVLEFQNLYKTEFGIEMTRDEAYDKGMRLLNLVSLIYKPITEKEEFETNNKRIKTIQKLLNN